MLKIAWSPNYCHPLKDGHRFPMEKYELIPRQLIHEGVITEENIFIPETMDEDVILAVHEKEYLHRLKHGLMTPKEMRKIGFPYSEILIDREYIIMYGTIQAALFALEHGAAFNMAGGTHHAYRDSGEGFCIFNDLAIGSQYLLNHHKACKILIVDLDVHQGNGTAAIFQNDDRVFTFSMHGGNNYPLHKEKSDMDIPLPDATEDAQYLAILNETLPKLIDTVKPDFIFYQSGVDVLATDKLGRMAMTQNGVKERDKLVLEQAYKHSIPITAVMGGGYSSQIREIIDAHCHVYRQAADIYC